MVEPLFDDFFSHTKSISTNSRPSYRTYLTNNVITALATPSVVEKNYIDIVAFSIASGNKSIALPIIGNMLSVLPKGKAHSALKSFETFISSSSCDSHMAQNSLSKCCVFGMRSSLFRNKKFKNSLRNQSRISGNKTWLPLTFLANLSDHYCFNFFNGWINDIYNKIYIILKDISSPASINHVLIKDIEYIGICRTGAVVALYKSSWYQVMTPKGYLNHKQDMEIYGDFSKISIDHVKPIDSTLNNLSLPALEVVSDFLKAFKNSSTLKGKKMENAAFTIFSSLTTKRGNVLNVSSLAGTSFKGGTIDINDLINDLYNILNDSHYRLMASTINSDKSNLLTYQRFYQDTTNNNYYGYIGKCKINSTTDGVIYQDLDTDFPNVIAETNWNSLSLGLSEINAVDIPIEKL